MRVLEDTVCQINFVRKLQGRDAEGATEVPLARPIALTARLSAPRREEPLRLARSIVRWGISDARNARHGRLVGYEKIPFLTAPPLGFRLLRYLDIGRSWKNL